MVADLVARDLLLLGIADGLVAGEVRLAITHDQIGERHRVARARSPRDGGERDRHRGVAVAEGANPFEVLIAAFPVAADVSTGATESAGGLELDAVDLAADVHPIDPVAGGRRFMVTVMASPRA